MLYDNPNIASMPLMRSCVFRLGLIAGSTLSFSKETRCALPTEVLVLFYLGLCEWDENRLGL